MHISINNPLTSINLHFGMIEDFGIPRVGKEKS